jgi:hypothetical protein
MHNWTVCIKKSYGGLSRACFQRLTPPPAPHAPRTIEGCCTPRTDSLRLVGVQCGPLRLLQATTIRVIYFSSCPNPSHQKNFSRVGKYTSRPYLGYLRFCGSVFARAIPWSVVPFFRHRRLFDNEIPFPPLPIAPKDCKTDQSGEKSLSRSQ